MAALVGEKLSELRVDGDWAASIPSLHRNLPILSTQQIDLAKLLLSEGQSHLFLHWSEPGIQDEKKRSFFDQAKHLYRGMGRIEPQLPQLILTGTQVALLNGSYPGGLVSYIRNARKLLADSKAGKNPYDGFKPSVPSGEVLSLGDENFVKLEEVGIREARNAAFVLVAGGLGERLGYKGIKLALPLEITTGTCFLQYYIESILALQDASNKFVQDKHHVDIPLVIMTSDDTHAATLRLLESNAYFGMKSSQVYLLKQEKVACLNDNDARLALDPNDNYKIQTKPHGHGDVHSLLYTSGLLMQWKNAGLKWILFFQDTNGLLFKVIPASLGVSFTKKYHVNSLAVPRKAKEAIGGITKLTHADGKQPAV